MLESSREPDPWPDARRFELLTFPVQDFAAMNASLGLILGIGIEAIAHHTRSLHQPIIDWAERNGATITSPSGMHRSAILCIKPRGDVAAAYARLEAVGVHCSLREGSLRLSPHVFNLPAEMAQVSQMLQAA